MANPQPRSTLRTLALAGAGVVALGLILSGVMVLDARRADVSDADRAATGAAIAEMDAAQARADAARAESQKRVYKGF